MFARLTDPHRADLTTNAVPPSPRGAPAQGSADVVAVLRCEARGAAIASGSVMPMSMRFTSTWSTVVMMVDPPGDPTTYLTVPSSSTIVGDIDERGRLLGSMRFGSVGL